MDVSDIQRADSPKSFFNPLSKEIVVDYRDDANIVDHVVLPPLKISEYPTYKADILIKHVVDAIINDRELGFVTPEDRKKIEEEVVI